MMRKCILLSLAFSLAIPIPAFATVFASLHGVVHDPHHRPLAGAHIVLQSADSDFSLSASTNADGEFDLPEAPIGFYKLAHKLLSPCGRMRPPVRSLRQLRSQSSGAPLVGRKDKKRSWLSKV